jgi:predicted acyl esterase
MALAALKNRVMLPDGTYAPWTSPKGAKLQLAAAAPSIPWTDLAYSLVPTGRTLDYVADNPYGARGGVMKQSFVTGLFALGAAGSNYAPPGADPDADLFSWYGLTTAGEPYDDNPLLLDAVDELTTHHSSYYVEADRKPAPLLISNGWTDDLFPVDEAVRFYNRTRTQFPKARLAMYHLDYGHQRGQSRQEDTARLAAAQREWLDHFLLGQGKKPAQDVRALTIACGEGAKSEGPYTAPSWRKLSPGEVRLTSAGAQTIVSPGDPTISRAFDPIAGGGACATADAADQAGTANYRLTVEREDGFTVLGSPTVIADVDAPSPHAQIAARLLDVDPATGQETLMARTLYRPEAAGRQVFQLHPTAYRVAKGHEVKLELLAADVPYGRISNGGGPVTVSELELRLPTAERHGEQIEKPAAKVLPEGTSLARGYKRFQRRALQRRGR